MDKGLHRPSDLELQVLGVLWEGGPMTARRVMEGLPDGKRRAYTTVLSVMQGMERKGLLLRKVDEVTHVWRAAVTRRQVMGPMMKNLVRNVFGGRPSVALQQLLRGAEVDAEELAEIRRVLDEAQGKRGKGRGR
jgi:BlaI family transcriptional regulator, penicillinase repressor